MLCIDCNDTLTADEAHYYETRCERCEKRADIKRDDRINDLSWTALLLENGERHVIPNNDLREHAEAPSCWCRPFYEDEVCVHNAMDEREKLERGERRRC